MDSILKMRTTPDQFHWFAKTYFPAIIGKKKLGEGFFIISNY